MGEMPAATAEVGCGMLSKDAESICDTRPMPISTCRTSFRSPFSIPSAHVGKKDSPDLSRSESGPTFAGENGRYERIFFIPDDTALIAALNPCLIPFARASRSAFPDDRKRLT